MARERAAGESEANISSEDDLEDLMARQVQEKNKELVAEEEKLTAERAACGGGVSGGATVAAAPSPAGATGNSKGAKGNGKEKVENGSFYLPLLCAHCGTENSATNPLSRCSRCRLVWYCKDGGCQRAAWPSHKTECRSVAAQAATDPMEELPRENAPSDFKCPIR